jgi:hypothetical protein
MNVSTSRRSAGGLKLSGPALWEAARHLGSGWLSAARIAILPITPFIATYTRPASVICTSLPAGGAPISGRDAIRLEAGKLPRSGLHVHVALLLRVARFPAHVDYFRMRRYPGKIANQRYSISGSPTVRVLSLNSEGHVVNWLEAARERLGGSAACGRIQAVTAITKHGHITGEADG